MDIFSTLFTMKVCCVFSVESPHRDDSNEYTQYTILNVKKKYPKARFDAKISICISISNTQILHCAFR